MANPLLNDESQLLIFDLDGTLYEDTSHFDLFATMLQKQLPQDKQEAFQKDYEKVKKGTHPLAIGKVYDAEEDIFWTWDPFTEQLASAESWQGKSMDSEFISTETFPVASFDFDRWIAIGDGWWPPYVLARHYGLPIEKSHGIYDEVKVIMSQEQGWLTHTQGLHNFLHHLKGKKHLVLLTNSDAEDAERLLTHLGLADLFDHKITSAMKPMETKKHFDQILKMFNVKPENTVSIGDNFMNEIAPALQFGMKSVWLTPDQPPLSHQHLWTLTSLKNM